MKLRELLSEVSIKGFKEALLLGLSEAEELGKDILGITLSNGYGIIFYVDPFNDEIIYTFLYIKNEIKDENLKLCCLFNTGDNTYFIYQILNFNEFIKKYCDGLEVIYVEVIKDDLEDFLHSTMDR
ncbi:hypothetical protein SUSAZ_06340 [Sulfolobus acidocaldarius SUSAZ]|nr:hypothetical protein SUSAZ_06340 [Sulfolobus acidocaldarius SUSAZ]